MLDRILNQEIKSRQYFVNLVVIRIATWKINPCIFKGPTVVKYMPNNKKGEQGWVVVENYKGSFPIERVYTLSV